MRTVGLNGSHHKNISYKPQKDRLSGLDEASAPVREQAHAIMRRFSEWAMKYVGGLLPRYSAQWRTDFASVRPMEEAGRSLPLKKRNDLLHVDAFPTRPTNGGLILRIFHNFHVSRPRVWWTTDPMDCLAPRYAVDAGLMHFAQRKWRLGKILHEVGLPVAARSPYDEFMLAFHDYLKGNEEFQRNCPKYRFQFEPGQTWMVFTDVVPHAVESGQFAMEQTMIVPRQALAAPDRAPISILETMAGRSLE